MEPRKIFALVLLVAGIALIVYGIGHMNTAQSEIKAFLGKEDTAGMFATGIGAVLVIVAAVISFRKAD